MVFTPVIADSQSQLLCRVGYMITDDSLDGEQLYVG